ncbi:hypothetical protein, partial [Staphylococcus aureus]|uniref:hypothetical protein n=1 Tax=Staphylococcus aureus TaxID=1280 RepID=UPI0039BE8617
MNAGEQTRHVAPDPADAIRAERFGWRSATLVLALPALLSIVPAITSDRVLSSADVISQIDPSFASTATTDPGTLLRFDSAYVFGPDLAEAKRQVLRGQIPSWMTGVGAGRPLLA